MKSCDQKSAAVCHYQERPLNETTTFQCDPHMIGQYVRIRKRRSESGASTRNSLVLCEVEVQGVAIGSFNVIKLCFFCQRGARCSSVVRAFAHDAMGCLNDPSWWTHYAISRSCSCSTPWYSCPVCGMVHIKEPLLLIGKSIPCRGSGVFISPSEWSFTICLTPYNRK